MRGNMANPINVVSWFTLAVICELAYQIFSKIRERIQEENDTYSDDNTSEPAKPEVQESEVKPQAHSLKIKRRCPVSKNVSSLADKPFPKKSSIFGSQSDLNDVHDSAWQDDPIIKNGYSRIDRVSEDGKATVTSYYDDSGKLVYQKEKSIGKAEEHVAPSFQIKPRLQAEPSQTTKSVAELHEEIDKQFNDLFKTTAKKIPKAKSLVDEHVDTTFEEIFKGFGAI